MGDACKAFLESQRGRLLIFDFANVRDHSTQALATPVGFQNAVAPLKQRLVLVAGDDLRELLEKSRVTSLFEIRPEIHSLILPELTFETKPAAAGGTARSSRTVSRFRRECFRSLWRVLI